MDREHELQNRLPIKLDSTSNGEFAPIPLEPQLVRARRLALEQADAHARRRGQGRREFLVSACGAASALLTLNAVHAAAGRSGGFFDIDPEAALDPELAVAQLGKRELIFDVQGHFVNPSGAWLAQLPPQAQPLSELPKAQCGHVEEGGERGYLRCLGSDEFIKDVFLDSDTDVMVLSFVPSRRDAEPLTIEEAAATREIVEKLEGSKRMLLHARVNPNQPGDVEDMERLKGFGVAAWKTYTQWGPDGKGFFLTDDVGVQFVEKARELGVRNIAVHKGLPFGRRSYEHSTCSDIGPIARQFPDVNFLIYHSGYVAGAEEGPYDAQREDGIDALCRSLRAAQIPRQGSNVYAELGSTWRFLSMRAPDSAAHALGKLFVELGEDNVLWGTDSIWYGSPQDQIQAFRRFQIAPQLREQFGYPELTDALREKVFGRNAARVYGLSAEELRKQTSRDAFATRRAQYQERPQPQFRTYGPRTRREFLNLLRRSGGHA